MVCLDTDVIINFLRNRNESVLLIQQIIEAGDILTTTNINTFELWKGIHKSYEKEKSLNEFLLKIKTLPFEDKASKKAAEIFEFLKEKGKMVDELDVMIGAISILNNEKILTFNKKHFEKIPDIRFFN